MKYHMLFKFMQLLLLQSSNKGLFITCDDCFLCASTTIGRMHHVDTYAGVGRQFPHYQSLPMKHIDTITWLTWCAIRILHIVHRAVGHACVSSICIISRRYAYADYKEIAVSNTAGEAGFWLHENAATYLDAKGKGITLSACSVSFTSKSRAPIFIFGYDYVLMI
jgi:hypothetical protein